MIDYESWFVKMWVRLNTQLKIISIGNGNGLELGPDGRRLPKTIAVFDVLSKL